MRSNHAALDALLPRAGALVFRGFAMPDTAAFNAFAGNYESTPFGYNAGAAPRARLAERVYESTAAPASEVQRLHQEMSYLPQYPKKVAFYCRVAPVVGGETIVDDMRRVTAALPRDLVREVERRGLLYTRNFRDKDVPTGDPYTDLVHRTWQDAFGTDDRERAAEACTAMGLAPEWLADRSLRTTYRAPGIMNHPVTAERIWFNQIPAQTPAQGVNSGRWAIYQRNYIPAGKPLPYLTTYGDGARIADEHVVALHAVLQAHTVYFSWSYGDVMLLDNYIAAHGRNSFSGLRDIQVALLN
jgi:alpha-ketoglutarate-dependent taurine dioxygenase